MALLPPILLLFDTSALLAGNTREWQEFAQLGECYVPEAVLEAMEFMSDRAADPENEGVAREFLRFYSDSGWKKTNVIAEHPSLKPASGSALSKRARLALEVLQGGYGMALRYPTSLIVLISLDQSLLQRIPALEKANLCGLPLAALVQWHRSQRRPPVISQHLQLMRSATSKPSNPAPGAPTKRPAGRQAMPTKPTTGGRAVPRATAPPATDWAAPKSRRGRFGLSLKLTRLLSNLISLAILLAAIALLWRFVSPTSFNQFWRQLPVVGNPK